MARVDGWVGKFEGCAIWPRYYCFFQGLSSIQTDYQITRLISWVAFVRNEVARPPGLEPGTCRLEGGCTIRLCYGREGREYGTN